MSRTWRRARLSGLVSTMRGCAAAIPDLIVCHVSGYGADGPYRDKKAYDLLIQAETGVVSVTGSEEEAAKSGIPVAEYCRRNVRVQQHFGGAAAARAGGGGMCAACLAV